MFNIFKKKKAVAVASKEVAAPVEGKLIDLSDVNDEVFSQRMMGDGFAIVPSASSTEIVSPIDGEVTMIPDTKHAVGLKNESGLEVLVHIGLDTVNLDGKGFEPLVAVGDTVKKGQPIMKINQKIFKDGGYDCTTMVIFTKGYDKKFEPSKEYNSQVNAGDVLAS